MPRGFFAVFCHVSLRLKKATVGANPTWQPESILFSCAGSMTKLRASLSVLLLWAFIAPAHASPPERPSLEILAYKEGEMYETNGIMAGTATNGVVAKYGDMVLTADRASFNLQEEGGIYAEGNVRLQRTNETFLADKLHYNYLTEQMDAEPFRTGKAPLFAAGHGLHGEGVVSTNGVYTATNALITTDDYYTPLQKIRAREMKFVSGQYVEARDATLYVGEVPVFYFPYYHRDLSNQNNFSFLPGYRSSFGPYLLSSYNWSLNDKLNGAVHLDERERRGLGAGPDFNYHLGQFGDGTLRYYLTHDLQPGLGDPTNGAAIPNNRQRLYFSYVANPLTNLTVNSQVAYQSDQFVIRDFFESQYRKDNEPNTFLEADQHWKNWSLDALVQPRVNPFFETVERLPDVRLSGYRQQIGNTPLFYESESSIGYYRRLFSDTNLTMAAFSASRVDSFHQITMPETFFGWLNVTPRAGARYTYYSEASGPGATTTEHNRDVFNTGAEISFKASRVWPGVQNQFLEMDGLRHIFEPSINYVYVPRPSVQPSELPQFDYQQTSFRMLPIEFPEYNSIDSISNQNTIRFGFDNRLQTKRKGEVDNLASLGVYTDWHLRPGTRETTFSDVFSEFEFKPRSWLIFDSETRFDVNKGRFNLSQSRLTFQPNDTWSWTVGQFFLRTTPEFGTGNDLITSTFFYRFNPNWGTRISHYFDARTGTLSEQNYSIYRDFRSWTGALTFRALNNLSSGTDYGVAFTFSFKSFPKFGLGQDTVSAASLVGY
ncbi:MAG: Organic solvent tolerance protein [Pedosphaera sp.]|nr:Organic solvent tolerance protein [Pedosphaera sp.]